MHTDSSSLVLPGVARLLLPLLYLKCLSLPQEAHQTVCGCKFCIGKGCTMHIVLVLSLEPIKTATVYSGIARASKILRTPPKCNWKALLFVSRRSFGCV